MKRKTVYVAFWIDWKGDFVADWSMEFPNKRPASSLAQSFRHRADLYAGILEFEL